MITGLLHAHSALRFLVLAAGAAALLWALVGMVGGRPYGRPMRILGSAFAGLLHLQVLIGLALLAAGIYYPMLIGHLVLMLLAAVAAQLPVSLLRRRPPEERGYVPHAAGTAAALALVWLGVAAIGRGLLEATVF